MMSYILFLMLHNAVLSVTHKNQKKIFFSPPLKTRRNFSRPPLKRVEIFLTPTPIGPGGVPHN